MGPRPPAVVSERRRGNLQARSRLWYLWSIFLANGIVIYFALRYDDERLARRCLWIGIAMLAIYPALFLVAGVASVFDQPMPYAGQ